MFIKTYGICTFDGNGNAIRFYDGATHQEDYKHLRLFAESDIVVVRMEQGSHQRLNPLSDVRLVEFVVELPFNIGQPEPPVPPDLPPVPVIEELKEVFSTSTKVAMPLTTEVNALAT
ncbi:hypothetical protein [Argonema galeatum]|uniref:hypothetical protein n=1 Tax=Argonema galeatum TaxID=2942762 RepID=UPI002011613B|nr:hypothetical protein [Argonema galeatum]MCL1466045.1 hypothetical protein [Argonema galeatum A003/A1]